MDGIEGLLVQQPIFSAFEPAGIDLIRPITRLTRFAAGSAVLRSGDPAEEFFLLTGGTVAIQAALRSRGGDGPITICTLTAGDLLGTSWVIEPRTWSYDVIAVDDVQALAVGANSFLLLCDREHSFGYRALRAVGQAIARRLRETTLQRLDIYAHWS